MLTTDDVSDMRLFLAAKRGIEEQVIVVIAMWYREAPPIRPQFYMDHGHSDGDVMTGLVAYSWYFCIEDF